MKVEHGVVVERLDAERAHERGPALCGHPSPREHVDRVARAAQSLDPNRPLLEAVVGCRARVRVTGCGGLTVRSA